MRIIKIINKFDINVSTKYHLLMYEEFEEKFYKALILHCSKTPSEKLYLELLEQEPNNSILNYLTAAAYHSKGNKKKANKYYKEAVELNSNLDFSPKFKNLDNMLYKAFGSLAFKENYFINPEIENALRIKPIFESVYGNVACRYTCDNDLSNTIKICKQGFEAYPNGRYIKWAIAAALLKTRFMEQGWEFYDDRILEFFKLPEEFMAKEVYNFQKTDKPIYLVFSGGLGDTIFFARYLPLLDKKGIKYICRPQKSMKRLFLASSFPFAEKEPDVNDFDYRITFMNLASLFKTSIDTIPFPDKYMRAAEQDVLNMKKKYFDTEKKKIGIVWNTGKNDIIRKIDLINFIPLFKNKNIQFYSLQREVADEERTILEQNNVMNIGETFTDWEDTAAALSNLDLYIGCDTSVSNLAGALGIKSLILVLDFCEWRWGLLEESTPWFTSTKVLRQKIHGDWSDVIKRVHKELNDICN